MAKKRIEKTGREENKKENGEKTCERKREEGKLRQKTGREKREKENRKTE